MMTGSPVYITPDGLWRMVDWVMFWVVNRPEFWPYNGLWVEDWSMFCWSPVYITPDEFLVTYGFCVKYDRFWMTNIMH